MRMPLDFLEVVLEEQSFSQNSFLFSLERFHEKKLLTKEGQNSLLMAALFLLVEKINPRPYPSLVFKD